MGDTTLRHIITILAVMVLALVYFAGYIAGSHGWWVLFVGVLITYPIIFKLVDV